MKVHQTELRVDTARSRFTNISQAVQAVVDESAISTGLCTVFIQHTSASLIIQENADSAVLRDLESWMSELVPQSRAWEHADEGPDDMPAHVRSAITQTSQNIPVSNGRLTFGTWQGLYLWEHRSHPHKRTIVVHVQGTLD